MGAHIFRGEVLTDDDMRALWRGGWPLSSVFYIAYRMRRLGRAAVREIVFGR